MFFDIFAGERISTKELYCLFSVISCLISQRAQTFIARSRLRWPVVRAGVDFLFLFLISEIEHSPTYHFPICISDMNKV